MYTKTVVLYMIDNVSFDSMSDAEDFKNGKEIVEQFVTEYFGDKRPTGYDFIQTYAGFSQIVRVALNELNSIVHKSYTDFYGKKYSLTAIVYEYLNNIDRFGRWWHNGILTSNCIRCAGMIEPKSF